MAFNDPVGVYEITATDLLTNAPTVVPMAVLPDEARPTPFPLFQQKK